MRVLVCGSRDWDDFQPITWMLDGMDRGEGAAGVVLIEGEAPGADTLAREWAEYYGDVVFKYPADWDKHGKAAGPIRNQQMLDEGKPDVVLAFKDNLDPSVGAKGGTEDMVRRALKAGVPVYVVSRA